MNTSIKVVLTWRITRVVYHRAGTYIHYMKDYRSSFLTLVTCDNIAIDWEEGVLEKNKLMAKEGIHMASVYYAAYILFTMHPSNTVCVIQFSGALLNYCIEICLRLASQCW